MKLSEEYGTLVVEFREPTLLRAIALGFAVPLAYVVIARTVEAFAIEDTGLRVV